MFELDVPRTPALVSRLPVRQCTARRALDTSIGVRDSQYTDVRARRALDTRIGLTVAPYTGSAARLETARLGTHSVDRGACRRLTEDAGVGIAYACDARDVRREAIVGSAPFTPMSPKSVGRGAEYPDTPSGCAAIDALNADAAISGSLVAVNGSRRPGTGSVQGHRDPSVTVAGSRASACRDSTEPAECSLSPRLRRRPAVPQPPARRSPPLRPRPRESLPVGRASSVRPARIFCRLSEVLRRQRLRSQSVSLLIASPPLAWGSAPNRHPTMIAR